MLKEYIKSLLKEELDNRFQSWFNGSKIVDKNGNPLIVYHGSPNNNISVFDEKLIGSNKGNSGHYGYGFYFSTYEMEAKTYGNNIYKCYIKIKKPFRGDINEIIRLKKYGLSNIDDLVPLSIDLQSLKNELKNNRIAIEYINSVEKNGYSKTWDYLRYKYKNNPEILHELNDFQHILEFTSLNKTFNGVSDYAYELLKKYNIKPKINKGFEYEQSLHWITDLGNRSQEFTNIIKQMGYDGVWYGSEIVAFYPNQIKSIENDGTWDSNDPNIYS